MKNTLCATGLLWLVFLFVIPACGGTPTSFVTEETTVAELVSTTNIIVKNQTETVTRSTTVIPVTFSTLTTTVFVPGTTILTTVAQPSTYDNNPMIELTETAFTPAVVVIKAGGTVTWVSSEHHEQVVVSDSPGFTGGTVYPDGRYSFTFNVPGRYDYHLESNSSTRGIVIVQ